MGAAGLLWYDTASNAPVLAYAKSAKYRVAATRPGRVEAVSVTLGQAVEAGQVLAVLDGRDLEAKIAVLEAETARVKADREAAAVKASVARQLLLQRMDTAAARAERDLVRAKQRRRVHGAQLKALRARRRQLDELLDAKLTTRARSDGELKVQLAGVREELGAAKPEVQLLEEQLVAVRQRRVSIAADHSHKGLLAPFEAKMQVLNRRIDGLLAERERLLIRAPVKGRVSRVSLRRGEVASTGMAVVTIVSDNVKNEVVACLDEARALAVKVGTKVEVRPKGANLVLSGRVVMLSPKVGALPVQCRAEPRKEVWGREVIVALDVPTELVAGQRFVARFDGAEIPHRDMARASTPAAVSKRDKAVRALKTPPKLARMTRFEASGLSWVEQLSRYVIVSDDTGHKRSNDDAAWVFTMDREGNLDDEPLVVTGITEWSDLEGIAEAPAGGLWVISSSSRSKKGRRPEKRQVFTRLMPATGRSFSAAPPVLLYTLLQKSSPQTLRDLGVGGGALERLNIEGLAAYPPSGLLIGLKAPLDDKGRAQIWHLRYPERLIDEGTLEAGELSLWATVKVSCSDGAGISHPGGVAELLLLPDGGLVIAATTSDKTKGSPAGALWYVRHPRAGHLSARLLRNFPSLKPEGLSKSPTAGQMMVVFDRGAQEQAWTELPWPRR